MKTININKLSFGGIILTLGIVYGDIGTSPLYVLRAIVSGCGGLSNDVMFGSLSCIIWTLTMQTTLKYVIITLRADNKGEGGIFALYALIRRRAKWLFIVAIIGGSMLLADGIITPAITVVSAVEGLQMINKEIPILPIVFVIITLLFFIQQFGTNLIGKSFGPIMFLWFTMLGVLGLIYIIQFPLILKAFNPYYAINFLLTHKSGFILLGAVFLCTTGAEDLYLDIGHCGVKNIRASWIYVKITLILNYLGQGAWLIQNPNIPADLNPFFAIVPKPEIFLLPCIIMATVAAIIASQALISGCFSIINEAILLNFWPKIKINHPTINKGQIYIPSVNKLLWAACLLVILYFQKSSNMEAAYGLAITITMLMTTTLMTYYLYMKKVPIYLVLLFPCVYFLIEGSFLVANLFKFFHGGWVSILIAGFLFFIMYVWYRGRNIKNRFTEYVKIDKFVNLLKDLKNDTSIPKYSTNLVYITRAIIPDEIESKIIYSIINKQPKRADIYWFIHIDITDEPYTMSYRTTHLIPDTLYRIDFKLGFRIPPRVNLYFRYAVEDLVLNKEIDITSRYESLKKHNIQGDFKFIIIHRVQGYDFEFPPVEQFIIDTYEVLRNIGITNEKAFGLDTSNVITEKVPLFVERKRDCHLQRV